MKPTFELRKTTNGRFMFNLRSADQETILTSQSYGTKRSAEDGIASVAQNAVLDERFERKVGADGRAYFILRAANKLVIGRSEMYGSREAMEKAIATVKRSAPAAQTIDVSAAAPV